jgi:hypothetical protein
MNLGLTLALCASLFVVPGSPSVVGVAEPQTPTTAQKKSNRLQEWFDCEITIA